MKRTGVLVLTVLIATTAVAVVLALGVAHDVQAESKIQLKNLGDSPVSLLCRSLGAVPGFSRLTVCLENFKNRDCTKRVTQAA
ncbi:MAG: hypothetical protein U9Q79_00020 [Candidatus Hydrogenedentes bacterium]|nr:hypothetical protein [Candidatus Hydrogenedentota bacterium]